MNGEFRGLMRTAGHVLDAKSDLGPPNVLTAVGAYLVVLTALGATLTVLRAPGAAVAVAV